MKKQLLLLAFICLCQSVIAQVTGSFTVSGDLNKFYPVTFTDGGWNNHAAAELHLGRSSVHENGEWRGSMIAKFEYHITGWGNGAAFINADIKQVNNGLSQNINFIAGWRDASATNGSGSIIIWLKGGGTTYHYKSAYPVSYAVYDGAANPLPFQEINGPAHSYKTAVDSYVNSYGITEAGSAFFGGATNNYFNGNVGIGTTLPTEKLSVKGKIRAQEIKVELAGWADFVFAKDYVLPTLQETENYIKDKGHLPGIPSASEVEKNGIELGDMNKKLLQKIEELTLYLIEMKKENNKQQEKIDQMKNQEDQITKLTARLDKL